MLRHQSLWLAGVATVLSTSAFAQGVPQRGAAAKPATDVLEEIVVTASRVEQNIQKVSAAVQVIDGENLSQQALTNVSQIFQSTPSIQVTGQPAGFSVDIRGQGADLPSGITQGAVATEFDGVYNITSLAAQVGFFDVDRIEVLPGPQSTRYGPNADGGVVNIISKDPMLGNYDGTATLTIGDYGLRRGEIAQNIAIGDTLALRVSGAAIHRDSYFKPATTNSIAQSGRAKLLYQPNDNLSIKLQVQIDHTGGTGNGAEPRFISVMSQYPSDSINNASYACSTIPTYSNLNCASPWNHGNQSSNGIPNDWNHADLTEVTYMGVVSYNFNNAAVLDITPSYIKGSGHQDACYSGPPGTVGGPFTCYRVYPFSPFKEKATEVRLHSAAGSRINWSVGYYHWDYFGHSWSEGPILGTTGSAPQNVAGPIGGGDNGTKTDAVFGDMIYPVSDRFRAIAGLRSSKDTRLNRRGGFTETTTASVRHTDYRLGEEFDLSPASMEYFTLATGYRPGLITTNGTTGVTYLLPNEEITSAELGFKNRFLNNTLQVNGDVFYYNEKNYQELDSYGNNGLPVTLLNPFTPQGGTLLPAGAQYTCRQQGTGVPPNPPECTNPSWDAQAYILGAEIQIKFNATPDDKLSLVATYLDARFNKGQTNCAVVGVPSTPGCWYGYNDSTGAVRFVNIAGAQQPHSPKLAANFGYTHTFYIGGSTLDLGGQAFYSSDYWVHPSEDLALKGWQPSYWLENLSANFTPANSNWSLSAFVRNLSNYAVKQSYVPGTTIGDPRTMGLTANLKW